GCGIAGMDHHPISEAKRLAWLDRDAPVARLVVIKIPLAERIRGEQAVAAGMPVSRMLRVTGVIVNRDADLLAIQLAGVIHPVRALPPDFLLALLALGVHHQAGALARGKRALRRLLESRCEPDRERALLG